MAMKLKTSTEVLAERLEDPEFRAEWESTELARKVAVALTSYRAANGLTQTDVARAVGISQPAVARLEAGTREPRLETLSRLSNALGIEFRIVITPSVPMTFGVDLKASRLGVQHRGRRASHAV
jgi:DNA-binding XRE family transcriptional regulator